jgi:hypothetical protein
MSATLFKKVDYSLAKLIHDIEQGEIGLPDGWEAMDYYTEFLIERRKLIAKVIRKGFERLLGQNSNV